MSVVVSHERANPTSRGIAWELAKARFSAAYALRIYLPVSILARHVRTASRWLRGRPVAPASLTTLPQVTWSQALQWRRIRLVAPTKHDGNVRLSELGVLAQAAAAVPAGGDIIEIGTFDGRTALNFAINARRGVSIATLDLPADQAPAMSIDRSERQYVDKPAPGARLRDCGEPWWPHADRVRQCLGDSATFDWSTFARRAGLVFVDGSHTYDYVRLDSETAMRLVNSHGLVLWHDYGVWPGVTRALEELEAERHLGLVHIRGTSLVFWRAPEIAPDLPDIMAGQDNEDELHLAPVEPALEQARSPALG